MDDYMDRVPATVACQIVEAALCGLLPFQCKEDQYTNPFHPQFTFSELLPVGGSYLNSHLCYPFFCHLRLPSTIRTNYFACG